MLQEPTIRRIFVVSVVLKALNAVLELLGGVVLLCTGALTRLTEFLLQGELLEDPADIVANAIQHYVPYLSSHTQLFASFYLLSHGAIKLVLAVGLLRRRLWAYPSAIAVFCLFIVYQLYRYTHTHSSFLLLLTAFDVVVILLTWHEYDYLRQRLARPQRERDSAHDPS